MSTLRFLLIASLMAAGCEDDLAHRTEHAAERVGKMSSRLRHERRDLAVEVAERADDRAANRDVTHHIGDIAEQVEDVTREAGALAEAQDDFELLKALRISQLRAEHSVAASQPLLITVIANAKSLLPTPRARLEETLVIFRERLANTRKLIEQLQYVSASDWERRDDELGREMAGMFLARDASWEALQEPKRDAKFPET